MMNKKAMKAAIARWLTVTLAPMSVIAAMIVITAETRVLTWILWGSTAVFMFAVIAVIEHKSGNHGK